MLETTIPSFFLRKTAGSAMYIPLVGSAPCYVDELPAKDAPSCTNTGTVRIFLAIIVDETAEL